MEDNKKEVININIDEILPNRFQPRLAFNEKELNELADSIMKYGVIQPVVVRKIGEKYEIIAGERRLKATTIAGLSTIPAIVIQADDNTSAEIALLENIQRKNLSPIEEAKSFKKLMDKGFTQEDLAYKLGVSQPLIANKIRLLNLPEDVQNALLYNQISERHARSLLALKNSDMQSALLTRIVNEKLTVKQTEEEIAQLVNENNLSNVKDSKEEVQELKKDILDDLEFIDLKIPDVVDIPEIEDSNPYMPEDNYSTIDTTENNTLENTYKEEINDTEVPLPITPFDNPTQSYEEVITDTTPYNPDTYTDSLESINNEINETSKYNETIQSEDNLINQNNDLSYEEATPLQENTVLEEVETSLESTIEPTIEETDKPKSLLEQLNAAPNMKETQESMNTSLEYNHIDRIDNILDTIKSKNEELTQEDAPTEPIRETYKNEFGEMSLPKVINKIRSVLNELDDVRDFIEISELDLDGTYQILFEIKKNNY